MAEKWKPDSESKLEEHRYRGVLFDWHFPADTIKRCEKFEFRPDDVLVATYPRSGTTLTQEIVWQICNHEKIEKGGQYGSLRDRFPFLEFSSLDKTSTSPIDILESKKEKRLIKTHLPIVFLQDQLEKVSPKCIVTIRNPKDTLVSYYHFYKNYLRVDDWNRSWDQFVNMFFNDEIMFGDYFDHVLGWWSLRTRNNVLILRYEDIVRNKYQQVRAIANFLGVDLTHEKIEAIAFNSEFGSMTKNKEVNFTFQNSSQTFIRQGSPGSWKQWFTVEQNEKMDRAIAERLGGQDLKLVFE